MTAKQVVVLFSLIITLIIITCVGIIITKECRDMLREKCEVCDAARNM